MKYLRETVLFAFESLRSEDTWLEDFWVLWAESQEQFILQHYYQQITVKFITDTKLLCVLQVRGMSLLLTRL
jgi:hypothetical protein